MPRLGYNDASPWSGGGSVREAQQQPPVVNRVLVDEMVGELGSGDRLALLADLAETGAVQTVNVTRMSRQELLAFLASYDS